MPDIRRCTSLRKASYGIDKNTRLLSVLKPQCAAQIDVKTFVFEARFLSRG